jgi:hypothetical protein
VDCSNHIILSGAAANYPTTAMPLKKINYEPSTVTTTTTEALSDYFTFTDTDANQCGPVTCSVYDSGCSNAYSGTEISIDGSNNIIFKHDVALGWGLTSALVP